MLTTAAAAVVWVAAALIWSLRPAVVTADRFLAAVAWSRSESGTGESS